MAVFLRTRHSVVYGQKRIDFRLLYCDRKTMEISVRPDHTVVVKVPVQADIRMIEEKMIKRAPWILQQFEYFRQARPKKRELCYVDGETHLYLGKRYRLKFMPGKKNSVKLSRGFFYISFRNEPTREFCRILLHQWYLEKAEYHFAKSMDHCWQKYGGFGPVKPGIVVRQMRKTWGSLSSRGIVTLNINLIKTSRECIDFVMTHELCHLIHHNHSPEFYHLLDSVLPDWKKIKRKLECSGA